MARDHKNQLSIYRQKPPTEQTFEFTNLYVRKHKNVNGMIRVDKKLKKL